MCPPPLPLTISNGLPPPLPSLPDPASAPDVVVDAAELLLELEIGPSSSVGASVVEGAKLL